MMDKLPFLSIIVPCRNEEEHIGKCLNSIIQNDYPKDRLEVFVVDGLSNDHTKKVVQEYGVRHPFIKLLDNQKKIVSVALNIGIKEAKGELIMRLDAHSTYGKNYISLCVQNHVENDVDNVGGPCITLPGSDTPRGKAIALGLSHPFGVGNQYCRIGAKEKMFVDGVTFGCYKKEVFDRIGLFDETLIRNQDDEFNLRLIKNGGKILLVPEILVYYIARDSLLKLWRMYYQYGYFKPLVAMKLGSVLSWRQLIPPLFVGVLGFTAILSPVIKYSAWLFSLLIFTYLLADIVFAYESGRKNGLRCVFSLFLVFPILHFSYGFGYLKGIIDFIILKKYTKNKIKDLPISR
jgi:glycosyltransferase involved in cell wall biosynthesis